ncbi:GNAT family N-acetyltransferase [Flavobacterium sp.]|uniref:GNAT family N-acetyltransferase n=1 Tax=Flavobacterium sp. TaxID=239 RepID=UPI002621F7F9|nr:GNAT family N-acetyltransferase [Flavobacterium sp.]
MENFKIRKYSEKDYNLWNDFVNQSENGTFLFLRDFMEYHKDRFEDGSLMIFEKETVVALLPANRKGNELHSHGGLTYGGLLVQENHGHAYLESLFTALCDYLKAASLEHLVFKSRPSFYTAGSNREWHNFLIRNGAALYRSDISMAIDYQRPLQIGKSKLKRYRKPENELLEVVQEQDFGPFWNEVLEPRLSEKYEAKPVHTLDEITLLHHKFPENIQQYSVYRDGRIVAGITLFVDTYVVKSQYGATTAEGEQLRALDYLFITLILKFKAEGKYFFDMGTVSQKEGKTYNPGLLKQKEELGCAMYTQDFYSLPL